MFQTINKYFLIEIIEEEVGKGKVIIPKSAKREMMRRLPISEGTIRVVPLGLSHDEDILRVGDKVRFATPAGLQLKADDENLVAVEVSNILGFERPETLVN